jgi:acylphosphatase
MSRDADFHTFRVTVFGRVQGVGFRAFVHREAIRRGIRGEVWNSLDGRVEMIIQSESEDVLLGLLEDLKSGPGVVENIESHPLSAAFLGSFRITPTR